MSEVVAIPFWKRYTMTIEEAAQYFRIGERKLRNLVTENPTADLHKALSAANWFVCKNIKIFVAWEPSIWYDMYTVSRLFQMKQEGAVVK